MNSGSSKKDVAGPKEEGGAVEAAMNLLKVDIERQKAISELPEAKQKELNDALMYDVDVNSFEAMKKQHAEYGIDYPYESWLLGQAMFVLADRLATKRLDK